MRSRSFAFFAVVALVAGAFFIPTAASDPAADGLVAYWPFDTDAEAVVGPDATTHGGAVTTSLYFAPNVPHNSGSLNLMAAGAHATVPEDSDLQMTAAYTISTWVNLGDRSTYRPIAVRGAGNANDIEVYFWPVGGGSNGELVVAHNRGNGGTFDYVYFPNTPTATWFHLAVTFNGYDVNAYFNGVPQTPLHGTTKAMAAPYDYDSSSHTGWLLGRVEHSAFGAVRHQAGLLDELRIYNVALPEPKVDALADYAEFQVTLAQLDDLNRVATSHSVEATLDPVLSYIPIDFSISGDANPTSAPTVVLSDGAGKASWSYTGNLAGIDTISASIAVDGGDSASVIKNWWEEGVKISGNTGPQLTNKKPYAYALDGWAVDVPDDPDGTPYGAISVNYRTLKTPCTFVPGENGEFALYTWSGVDMAYLDNWESPGCAILDADIQILHTASPLGAGRGAIYIVVADNEGTELVDEAAVYSIISPITSPWSGWWPLWNGNAHIYDLI